MQTIFACIFALFGLFMFGAIAAACLQGAEVRKENAHVEKLIANLPPEDQLRLRREYRKTVDFDLRETCMPSKVKPEDRRKE